MWWAGVQGKGPQGLGQAGARAPQACQAFDLGHLASETQIPILYITHCVVLQQSWQTKTWQSGVTASKL